MEAIDCLLNRRSIRKFTGAPVSQEMLNRLLEAGMYAPSARNYQPWHFVLITEKHLREKVCDFHPYASMLPEAAAGILVCGDLEKEPNEAYINQNCAAATQNILLAAYALGLGAVWLGVYPREARIEGARNLFGLPPHILPVSLIALGFPAEEKERPLRFKAERIHLNHWGHSEGDI